MLAKLNCFAGTRPSAAAHETREAQQGALVSAQGNSTSRTAATIRSTQYRIGAPRLGLVLVPSGAVLGVSSERTGYGPSLPER